MSGEPAPATPDRQLEAVREIFDREIRPRLAAHLGGGNVTGIDPDGVVHVDFTGACTSCAYRRNTIVGAIYPRLRDVEGVRGVASPGVTVTIREQHRVAELFDKYKPRADEDDNRQLR